jgi:hypothetical protein
MKLSYLLAAVALSLSAATVESEEWPHFRGPTGQGISSEKDPPLKWSRIGKHRVGDGDSRRIVVVSHRIGRARLSYDSDGLRRILSRAFTRCEKRRDAVGPRGFQTTAASQGGPQYLRRRRPL